MIMLNGGFCFMFCLAKVLFCSPAEAQAVAVPGGCSAAGNSVLIQDFCADIRPGEVLFHIFPCRIAGHSRVAPGAGGCVAPCCCGVCARRCWLVALSLV